MVLFWGSVWGQEFRRFDVVSSTDPSLGGLATSLAWLARLTWRAACLAGVVGFAGLACLPGLAGRLARLAAGL